MKDWGRFYFSFKGRATRSDFNLRYALVALVGLLAALGLDCLWAGRVVNINDPLDAPIYNAFSVLATVSCFAVSCRRLHDLNYSGWWQALYYGAMVLIATACLYTLSLEGFATDMPTELAPMSRNQMILIVGVSVVMLSASLFFFLMLSARRGTTGPNRFGPDPLQSNTTETLS